MKCRLYGQLFYLGRNKGIALDRLIHCSHGPHVYGLCFNNMATHLFSFSEFLKLGNVGIQNNLSVEFISIFLDWISKTLVRCTPGSSWQHCLLHSLCVYQEVTCTARSTKSHMYREIALTNLQCSWSKVHTQTHTRAHIQTHPFLPYIFT